MTALHYRGDFFDTYTAHAPLALAFERILEGKLLWEETIEPPVLDVGCGDGMFASFLFSDRIDTGIDPNDQELRCAARVGGYRELICCSGATIPKPDASYRTVFSNSVLEHIPDLEPVLREIFRVLMPGGSLYIAVPTDTFERWTVIDLFLSRLGLNKIAARYRNFFNKFWRHYHAYSQMEWEAFLVRSGFQVKNSIRYNAPRIALANDLFAPVALPSMLLKKFTGRWILWPALRRILFLPVRPLFHRWLRTVRHPMGCLLFVRAIKPPAP